MRFHVNICPPKNFMQLERTKAQFYNDSTYNLLFICQSLHLREKYTIIDQENVSVSVTHKNSVAYTIHMLFEHSFYSMSEPT
jgi:hypothetical protein